MQTDSFLIPSVFWGAHCKVLKHLVVTEIFMSVFHYVCISFALSLSLSLFKPNPRQPTNGWTLDSTDLTLATYTISAQRFKLKVNT